MLLLLIFRSKRLKCYFIFLPQSVHFTPELQQWKPDPAMGWRHGLEIPCTPGMVWPWAQNPGTTAHTHVPRKRFAQDRPTRAGRMVQMGSTTICPISVTVRDFTSPRMPKWGALGSPWGFGRCQPSQVPTAPAPHWARCAGWTSRRSFPCSVGWTEGREGARRGEGQGGAGRRSGPQKPPSHHVGLPWKLSPGRKRRNKASLGPQHWPLLVVCCAQFLSMYKTPLQDHNRAVDEVQPRYPLCTDKTKSSFRAIFLFFHATRFSFEMKLAKLSLSKFSVHCFCRSWREFCHNKFNSIFILVFAGGSFEWIP